MDEETKKGIFERLRHSLQLLASPSHIQLGLLPSFVVKADELALDFDHWMEVVFNNWKGDLSPLQLSVLTEIHDKLQWLTHDSKDHWTEEAICDSPHWENIRSLAMNALQAFDWPVETPPSYAHEYVGGPACYKVFVVVDRSFGERLAELPEGKPVWIVDTPTNNAVVRRLWNERTQHDHLTGITIFNDDSSSSTEAILLSELDTIDLHHGPHSADPPYMELEVFGTPLSDAVQRELSRYGFDVFESTKEGFRCSRSSATYQV